MIKLDDPREPQPSAPEVLRGTYAELLIALRRVLKAHDNCRYVWGPSPELHEALEALRELAASDPLEALALPGRGLL